MNSRVILMLFAALVATPVKRVPRLLPGADFGDATVAVDPQVAGISWLGVFPSRVTTVRVSAEKTGKDEYRVHTNPSGAVFLVADIPRVTIGPVVTLPVGVPLDHEHRQIDLRLGNRMYAIRLAGDDPAYCDSVITLESNGRSQTLLEPAMRNENDSCDEPEFRVEWSGDVDHDGQLDLLVKFSYQHSVYPYQLLLSSAAKGNDLVAEAARHEDLE